MKTFDSQDSICHNEEIIWAHTHTHKQGRLGFREGECLVLGVLWWRTWIHVPPAASSTKEVSCYDTHKRHSLKGALRTFLWRFFSTSFASNTHHHHPSEGGRRSPHFAQTWSVNQALVFYREMATRTAYQKKIKPLARKSCLHCIFLWKLVNGSLAWKGNAHTKKELFARALGSSIQPHPPQNIRGHKSEIQWIVYKLCNKKPIVLLFETFWIGGRFFTPVRGPFLWHFCYFGGLRFFLPFLYCCFSFVFVCFVFY